MEGLTVLRQFNYFGVGTDEVFVAQTLIEVLGDLCALPDRGRIYELVPKRVGSPQDLTRQTAGRKILLLPAGMADRIRLRAVPNHLHVIDMHRCPVVEFMPSGRIDQQTVEVGRIAFFADGYRELEKKIAAVFRRLRRAGRKFGPFWVLNEAASTAHALLEWGATKPTPNPFTDVLVRNPR